MPNINETLNNVIAVVVVILILSLIVQSVQSVLKKLFKIKSRQIEESLVDLFTNVLNKPAFQPKSRLDKLIDHSPVWRIIIFWCPNAAQQAKVEDIYEHVVKGFRDIGRLAQSGKQMLDSIAKEDLLKVLEKVPIRTVLPGFVEGVTPAFQQITRLQNELDNSRAAALGGAPQQFAQIASDYASIEARLGPLFNEIRTITEAQRERQLASPPSATPPDRIGEPQAPEQAGEAPLDLLVRDIMALNEINRQIDIAAVLELFGEVQAKVTNASKTVASDTPPHTALLALDTKLQQAQSNITALRQQLDAVVGAFQAKASEVGKWYDLVMQSFEERYNRSMKSWAIVIAFLVVMVLNANFFNIYRNIATSDVTRDLLMEKGGDVLNLSRQRVTGGGTSATQPETQATMQLATQAATQPAIQTTTRPTTQTARQPATQTAIQPPPKDETQSASPESQKEKAAADEKATSEKAESEQANKDLDNKKDIEKAIELVKSDADLYKGIGFTPLGWEQVKHWFVGLTPDKTTEQPWGLWWLSRKHDIIVFLGWIVMTMLLSIGAPFWQDALESLFGVKNLLRKKGDIKNVETKSGKGQPKP